MKKHTLMIDFDDRIGLGYEIFDCFLQKNTSLEKMEASASGKIYLRTQPLETKEFLNIMHMIKNIRGVNNVEKVPYLPSELRAHESQYVFEAIKEGILVVNKQGKILECNKAAKVLLLGHDAINISLKGKPVTEYLQLPCSFKKLTEVKVTQRVKLLQQGNKTCFLNGYPIYADGQLFRIVFILQDIETIHKLVYNVTILPQMHNFGDIIFQSKPMQELVNRALYAADSDANILIIGESGTGKELLAKSLHMTSKRREYPFVAINCAALPENLLESELFGYEEGSFTGSKKGGKEGLFEFADKGTLFLDEIGEMPLGMQAKLLRVLQDHKARRVGGLREYSFDVRIISATNKNLRELISIGEFRSDLYYRLNVIPLIMPPLRERKDDIPLLAQHFADKVSQKLGRSPIVLKEDLIQELLKYDWPGNIRELENVIERTIIFNEGLELGAENLILDRNEYPVILPPDKGKILMRVIEDILQEDNQIRLKDIIEMIEREILLFLVKKYRSSRRIGQMLGISNTAVINKMHKYGVTYPK